MDLLKKLVGVFTKRVDDTSDAGKVDSTDVVKVLRTCLLVGISTGLSHFLTAVDPSTLGPYQGLVILGLTGVQEFLVKLMKDNK